MKVLILTSKENGDLLVGVNTRDLPTLEDLDAVCREGQAPVMVIVKANGIWEIIVTERTEAYDLLCRKVFSDSYDEAVARTEPAKEEPTNSARRKVGYCLVGVALVAVAAYGFRKLMS